MEDDYLNQRPGDLYREAPILPLRFLIVKNGMYLVIELSTLKKKEQHSLEKGMSLCGLNSKRFLTAGLTRE